MAGLLPFADAQAKVLALARPIAEVPRERVSLDHASGRVLLEEVRPLSDLPAFDYSAMDGYAVRAGDFSGAPPYLFAVLGESRTGMTPAPLEPQSVARIFTGAGIPEGADAVVMQERVTREGDRASFAELPKPGAHIRRRGEDLAEGRTALTPGTRLHAGHLALAAMCDRAWLEVARRPVVTFIGTGDELRLPGTPGRAGSIPESNGAALRAMALAAGADARLSPAVPDEQAETVRAFERALAGSDLLVTIGGVSVGDHDLVRPALEAMGVTLAFWKVAIKPGKPIAIGRRGGSVVLGLPGNPASALVTFALFGVPLLRAMAGDAAPLPVPFWAKLEAPFRQEPGRLTFVRATLRRERDALWACPLSNQASGAVTSMASADALLLIPAEASSLDAGADVQVLLAHELGL